MRLALPTLLALLALCAWTAPGAASPPPAALPMVAAALAREVGPPVEGRRALVLVVETRAAALRGPAETALDGALSALGYSVTCDRSGGSDPEASARAAGKDWLLRVRAGLVPSRSELALVGEVIPTWRSFFLQRDPAARAIPPRVVQARVAADPETLLLAREGRPAGAPFAAIRVLARVPGRVLALAVGEPGERGRPAVVVATVEEVVVLSPSGERIAERAEPAPAPSVREPAAALAVGDFGAGRIALFRSGAARGEVLALRGDRLEPAGSLDAAPLCVGDRGPLFGAFAPGTGVFRDVIAPRADPAAPGRSARTLYGAACAPHGGAIAFAVLGTDLALELLGPDLGPAALPAATAIRPAPLTGSGFALADLDGDGTAELVASSPDPAAAERIRVLSPLAPAPLLLESPPTAARILAGAGGDLTGDGLDDAVLGAVIAGAGVAESTELLLVTSDPRGVAP